MILRVKWRYLSVGKYFHNITRPALQLLQIVRLSAQWQIHGARSVGQHRLIMTQPLAGNVLRPNSGLIQLLPSRIGEAEIWAGRSAVRLFWAILFIVRVYN